MCEFGWRSLDKEQEFCQWEAWGFNLKKKCIMTCCWEKLGSKELFSVAGIKVLKNLKSSLSEGDENVLS